MREFADGFTTLGRGIAFWRRSPGTMALGLVPALIVGALALAGLVTLGFLVDELSTALTPFAETWAPVWTITVRAAVGVALFGVAIVLVVVSFTALTLVVGEPFYDRIWRAVERAETGEVPDSPYGFWRAVGDAAALLARGVGVALIAGLVGLVPVIGAIAGFVVGLLLTAWVLADELTSRALTARGIRRPDRRRMLRTHRARALGFGVATQLCFLVPLGAVAVMPAAVAGSTLLAQHLVRPVSAAPSPASGSSESTPPALG
jgi:CysZ protein